MLLFSLSFLPSGREHGVKRRYGGRPPRAGHRPVRPTAQHPFVPGQFAVWHALRPVVSRQDQAVQERRRGVAAPVIRRAAAAAAATAAAAAEEIVQHATSVVLHAAVVYAPDAHDTALTDACVSFFLPFSEPPGLVFLSFFVLSFRPCSPLTLPYQNRPSFDTFTCLCFCKRPESYKNVSVTN